MPTKKPARFVICSAQFPDLPVRGRDGKVVGMPSGLQFLVQGTTFTIYAENAVLFTEAEADAEIQALTTLDESDPMLGVPTKFEKLDALDPDGVIAAILFCNSTLQEEYASVMKEVQTRTMEKLAARFSRPVVKVVQDKFDADHLVRMAVNYENDPGDELLVDSSDRRH
jgi:hypothetical protein